MFIKVNLKQLGSKKDKIKAADFYLENAPQNVRELISGAVKTCVGEYNGRVHQGDSPKPLTAENISDMSELGKIAFGINYGGREADPKAAEETALQAYEDGLFCIFIGEKRTGGLDQEVDLSENDTVTFIKLTMLTGRLW